MKKILAFLYLLLSVALLSSCSTSIQDAEALEDTDEQSDIELTLWTFPIGNWGNATTVGNILNSFHKEYPDIHVSVEYLTYSNGDEIINQAALNGSAPDLVLEGPERLVANWGEKGWMVDLSDLWESDTAGEIYENIREACQYSNGDYYEFPLCMAAHCMAINYDMFREAGALSYIDEESHTWTTENFINAVHALTDYGIENAGVIYCKDQSGDQGTRALITNLYSGTFTDEAHTCYTIDREENQRALQLLYDLEGITFDPTLTSSDAIDLFCRQESAMCFCWNGSIEVQKTINGPNPDFHVFPIAFPTDGESPDLQGGIWGFGIFDSGNEERIEAAKTFIRFISENDTIYTRAVQASSYWPVRDIEDIYENDLLMTEYSIFMPYMGSYYQITPGWAEARTAWWQMLAEISRGTDIAEAVKDFPSPK